METMKAEAWRKIEEGGAALRKADPSLTPVKARDLFMRTEAGKDLVRKYHLPHANLPRDEFEAREASHARLEKLGAANWGQVLSDLAKGFARVHKVDYYEGLRLARKAAPDVAAEYDHERGFVQLRKVIS